MENKNKGSIAIIGGGISGLCSAYYLRKKGFEVTVLDRGNLSDGCSYGNAGMIVPSHFIPLAAPGMISKGLRWMLNAESPFYIRPRLDKDLLSWGLKFYKAATPKKVAQAVPVIRDLNLRSKDLFLELIEEEKLNVAIHKKGLLMYCLEEHTLHEEAVVAEQAVALGMKAEVLDRAGIAKLEPELETNVAGAVYFPQDAFLTPNTFMEALLQKVVAMGVVIHDKAEVVRFVPGTNGIKSVITSRAEVTADQYVIAAGSWSSAVLKGLQLNIPIQAGKGYSVTIPDPPVMPRICNILTEARVAITPMDNGLRVAGTMEISGLDLSVNMNRVRGIYKSLSRYFPQFSGYDLSPLQVWAGLRPASPDGLPFIGRFKKYDNLLIAAGHGMMGFSLGPVTGKLVSQIASDEKPEIDLALLEPERYR